MKGWLEERRDGAVEVWTCVKLKRKEEKNEEDISVAGCFLYEEELYRRANQTNLTDTNKLIFMAQ